MLIEVCTDLNLSLATPAKSASNAVGQAMRRTNHPSIHHPRAIRIIITIAALALSCIMANAQEIATRQQSASLQAFGLLSYVQPHYDPSNNIGGTFGADLDFRPLYRYRPSLDLRATFAPGSDVSETTYDFGPRIEADFGRIRPYACFLIGHGSITFQHPIITPAGPYTHDDSLVYSGGFGADYMLSRSLGLRGDFMLQRWNLAGTGSNSTPPFHPRLLSLGVDYRFDFNRVHIHKQRE